MKLDLFGLGPTTRTHRVCDRVYPPSPSLAGSALGLFQFGP